MWKTVKYGYKLYLYGTFFFIIVISFDETYVILKECFVTIKITKKNFVMVAKENL